MLARESVVIGEIETEKAKRRQAAAADRTNGKCPSATLPQPVAELAEKGETRQKVAEMLGVGHETARVAMKVGQALIRLEQSDSQEDQVKAAALKKVLSEDER